MSQTYVDIIQSMSGVVTILAGFFGAFFYLRRRTRDWKVIIAASLVIAILVGAGFYGFGAQVVKGAVDNIAPTPKHTLNDYCKYYLAGDYGRVYDELLSVNSPLKERNTRAEFIQATIDNLKQVDGLKNCIVNDDLKENGNFPKGTITFIHGNGAATSEYMLEKDGNEWKILLLIYV